MQKLKLRNYQQADVDYLSQQKQIAIFNEMRTGKTPTSLKIYEKWCQQENKEMSLLIICPATLQNHWQVSVEQWLEKPSVILTNLTFSQRQNVYRKFSYGKPIIAIISKDTFKGDSFFFKVWRTGQPTFPFVIIIDEAHFLRNWTSQQSEAVYTLNDNKYKMVLTGTPLVNHGADIFGILKFLKPELFPNYWDFCERYFYIHHYWKKIENRYGKEFSFLIRKALGYRGKKEKEELNGIINTFSVSHTQKEVMTWLPKVEFREIKLQMEKEQAQVYNRWLDSWDKKNPLQLLTWMKTIILYPPALIKYKEVMMDDGTILVDPKLNERTDPLLESEKKLLKNITGAKILWVNDFCLNQEKDLSILIFSTRTATFLEPLAFYLNTSFSYRGRNDKVGLIVGSVSQKKRLETVNDFQKGKIRVLLCNIISAGVGLNLSQADIVIFADRAWSPADNQQAEDRFLPVDETNVKPKVVIDLVMEKTIDEKVLKLLSKKQDITKLVIDNPDILL